MHILAIVSHLKNNLVKREFQTWTELTVKGALFISIFMLAQIPTVSIFKIETKGPMRKALLSFSFRDSGIFQCQNLTEQYSQIIYYGPVVKMIVI